MGAFENGDLGDLEDRGLEDRGLEDRDFEGVAVVGLAGRFPGARDIHEFWRLLRDGREAITHFDDEELRAAGVPGDLLADRRYVKAAAVIEGEDEFDAGLFGFTPREAALLDPQHRLFLETAWEALEDAGCDPRRFPGTIGVFGGAGAAPPPLPPGEEAGDLLPSGPGFLTTRVAYKLGLRGPALDVQTACSTSLVAVVQAYHSLLSFQCDLALAGGVTVRLPQRTGYLHRPGGILSPDGRCRAFAAGAAGTLPGNGVGLVALRRLEDALEDGDAIRAVIRGAAINNDGDAKVGYAAPSVAGQARVIAQAQALAGVEANTVTYVEAHGTGTALGDPIEVEALQQAFRDGGATGRGFCALGTVKSNFGHLDAAAGVAGLIKTVLALEHREIPPSLHFDAPHEKIDFASGPFYVAAERRVWTPSAGAPRRAGVSSFGIGGTNAHVVLEEAPEKTPSDPGHACELLTLSARSEEALAAVSARLADAFCGDGLDCRRPSLADAAWTLQTGRTSHRHRRIVVARDLEDAASRLREADPGVVARGEPGVVFLFPGQGARVEPIAEELSSEDVFREVIEACDVRLDFDLWGWLQHPAAGSPLPTATAQPALFALELALARLWESWGVVPRAMLGHSLGEYVAACLAGVFSREDALDLVAERGRLMQSTEKGGLLAVELAEDEARRHLGQGIFLAAVNGPGQCVLSGDDDALDEAALNLAATGARTRRLDVDRAFHSGHMERILDRFRDEVRARRPRPPERPYLSNVTGTWITAEEATDPDYWARHLRQTVRFSDAARELLRQEEAPVFLEVGPGKTLGALVRRRPELPGAASVIESPVIESPVEDFRRLTHALGRLWQIGVEFDWAAVHGGRRRQRVSLPSYPFERRSYPHPAARKVKPRLAQAWEDGAPKLELDRLIAELAPAERNGAEEGRKAADEDVRSAAADEDVRSAAADEDVRSAVLDPLAASAVESFFRAQGVDLTAGQAWRRDELCATLGALPKYRRFVDFLTEVLVEDGVLHREGDELVATGVELPSPEAVVREIEAERGNLAELARFVADCAASYGKVLRGEKAALSVLYPAGRSDRLERASAHAESYGTMEKLTRQTVDLVSRLLLDRSSSRPLRILEVGAGQGLLTWRLAPLLADGKAEYLFTDLGRAFLRDAAHRAKEDGYSAFSFAQLDISRDPLAQGRTAESFDLVLAVNVIHATPRLAETLTHLRRLLVPGGLLAALETVRVLRWGTMIWGLTDGWWNFSDTSLRERSPLLPIAAWEKLLGETGFEARTLPRRGAERDSAETALLLAQKPAARATAEPPARGEATAAARSSGAETPREDAPDWENQPRPALVTRYLAPRDELEGRLASVWRDVLGVEPVGVRDNFFELGGDSLTGLRMLDALGRELETELPAVSVYEHPTVESLARLLRPKSERSADRESSPFFDRARRAGERRRRRLEARQPISGRGEGNPE